MILGDLIVKGLNEYGLSKKQNVKVQSFSGYATEDMLDMVKPAAQHKPDGRIIHARTNDITQDINTMKNIRKIVKSIRDCSESIIVWNNQIKFPTAHGKLEIVFRPFH